MISDHHQPPGELKLPRASPQPANPQEKGTENINPHTPKSVAIKNEPDPLFSITYGKF
jgi:hypothetical protein